MVAADIIEYCLQKPGAAETYPFGPDTLVCKVGGKMFALFSLDTDTLSANLKCDPQWAQELRDEWDEIRPGYHMNKKHWNTIHLSGRLPLALLRKMADHSYDSVVASLPVTIRRGLSQVNDDGTH